MKEGREILGRLDFERLKTAVALIGAPEREVSQASAEGLLDGEERDIDELFGDGDAPLRDKIVAAVKFCLLPSDWKAALEAIGIVDPTVKGPTLNEAWVVASKDEKIELLDLMGIVPEHRPWSFRDVVEVDPAIMAQAEADHPFDWRARHAAERAATAASAAPVEVVVEVDPVPESVEVAAEPVAKCPIADCEGGNRWEIVGGVRHDLGPCGVCHPEAYAAEVVEVTEPIVIKPRGKGKKNPGRIYTAEERAAFVAERGMRMAA